MVVMDILDTFLTDCRDAVGTGQQAVLGVVSQTLTDPERFAAAVRARPKPWFFAADDEVTVFCTEARPGSASAPHSHGTWSVLGCFDGSEESWWHRPAEPSSGMDRLEVVGSGVLRAGEAHALASHVVHAVMNRWTSPNGIVHVYAGNFLASERHIWDPVTGERHDAGLRWHRQIRTHLLRSPRAAFRSPGRHSPRCRSLTSTKSRTGSRMRSGCKR
jgi:predicted metal-dependent enzyme (double-stranded beta helix superfamily)